MLIYHMISFGSTQVSHSVGKKGMFLIQQCWVFIVNSLLCPLIPGEMRKFHSYGEIYDVSILSLGPADSKEHTVSMSNQNFTMLKFPLIRAQDKESVDFCLCVSCIVICLTASI